MAKIQIMAKEVAGIWIPTLSRRFIHIGLEMTEEQMFNALKQFLGKVTDATWAEWQDKINGENAYGQGN
jgi:hypothetical protein